MQQREAIAIVGIGCRFPGDVNSPADLATLLASKRSAIRDVPHDRWDRDAFYHHDFQKPGYLHVRRGGFLSRVDEFDAAFFGISPNEAKRMDPQQRIVLETAFAAIEDAGVRLEQLAGRSVAVTIGAGLSDYCGLTSVPSERANISGTSNTGSAFSIVANRVSYLFDLRGPSFAVDTACSSSLTALHLACRAIWEGSAEAALTGGANVILKPEVTLGFSKGGYLSPDAECRAFSDDANGYVRGEGVAIALLKPLSRALADGDRIYALIRNTWINQDGRTSGMTVPNQSVQEDLIRRAFDGAGVDPAKASYVEAHGTGTPAGDPIEAQAIGAVVGLAKGRTDPCYFGSVKTNLGHMEFTAGMGGLIKLALILQQRRVLPNINFRRPNPKLDLERLRLRLATECTPLPDEGSLFGGVNSFGFGGANGHVVLESPPTRRAKKTSTSGGAPKIAKAPNVLVLSARSQTALRTLAESVAERLQDDTCNIDDIAEALMRRRSRFEFRLALVGDDRTEISKALVEFAKTAEPIASSSPTACDVIVGRAKEGRTENVGFVFTGQGAQWYAMGRSLLASNATYRAVVEQVEAELQTLGWLVDEGSTLRAELLREQSLSRMNETQIAQPCLFALQVALTCLLAERGVTPAAVVGHSIGELAAAVACGALTLKEATRIVFWRSRCQAGAEGSGAMAALGVTEREAAKLVAKHPGQVEIAAVNGPAAVTIAGAHVVVESIVAELEKQGTFCRRLDVSVPFHCHLMDPIEGEFRDRLGPVTSAPARVPFFSTVTGASHEGPLDLDYWYGNIRKPVLYADALRAMSKSGVACFIEIGPHPALMHASLDTFREQATRSTFIPTLRREQDDARELARTLARLFVFGAACEPTGDGSTAPFVDLPPHPFERQRFWLETDAGREARMFPIARVHPHLGPIEPSAHADNVFSCSLLLDPKVDSYLADHVVQGLIVFPATGQGEVVLAAARHVYGATDVILEEVEFRRPMILANGDQPTQFRLEIYGDDGHFVIASRVGGATQSEGSARSRTSGAWMEHTRGTVRRSRNGEVPRFDLELLRQRIDIGVSTPDRYRAYARASLALGPTFRGILRSHRNESHTEILSEIEPHPSIAADAHKFVVHPTIVDACIQSVIDTEHGDSQQLYLPHRLGEVRIFGPVPKGRIWAYVRIRSSSREEACADIDIMDEHGLVFMRMRPLIARVVQGPQARFGAGLVYDHEWRPSDRPVDASARRIEEGAWLLFQGRNAFSVEAARAVERELRGMGRRVVRVTLEGEFTERDRDVFETCVDSISDATRLLSAVDAPICGVVHMWSCDLDPEALNPALDGSRVGAIPLGYLLTAIGEARAWAKQGREVWIVTQRATTVPVLGLDSSPARTELRDDQEMKVGAATAWGFGRVLISEQPRVQTTLIDLGSSSADIAELAREIALGPSDAEVAFRDGRRFTRALTRSEELKLPRRVLDAKMDTLRAVVRTPGVLDSITLEQFYPEDLKPDEIEIAVRAAGLNFRDAAAAMNLLPKMALEGGVIAPNQIGSDAAGVVRRVGANVTHLRPGDNVLGYFINASVATRVVGKAAHVCKMAGGISFADAATLPLTFLTVDTALNELARLKRGETILIHAAAGGVGTMAVQMAHHLGATVIATTSTEEKRTFLRTLGVKHIFNSRTSDFGEEVLELTHGQGVDVVLNSLSGAAITESLRCLRSFGRFVEIGKTDLYRNRQIGLLSLADNKSYMCLDANRLAATVNAPPILRRAMEACESGAFGTRPIRKFPLTESAAAIRCLAQGKQIGKIVIEVPEDGPLEADASTELRLDSSAVYLITGGCTGFGLALAEWLCSKGARSLVLAGRRGLPGEVEKEKVAALRARGVHVDVRNADVCSRDDVSKLVDEARAQGRLAGVFHAATVLDDAPISTQDESRYERVLGAKAAGAYHLHLATRNAPIDYFVLFSSISAVVGTPGQANYAAANSFLDELAAWRRTRALPATSINWGIIEDVGMVARASSEQRGKILGQGVFGLPSERALELLERILLDGSTRRVVADLDTKKLTQMGSARRRFAALLGQEAEGSTLGSVESLRAKVQKTPDAERLALVATALTGVISRVAGLGDQTLDIDASLSRYGFDSLMIAQLQTWIEEQLGVSIAMVHLMRGPTTVELAKDLLAQCADTHTNGSDNSLLKPISRVDGSRFALVCFPPMGMGSEIFALLKEGLPDDVALFGFDLPLLTGTNASLLMRSMDDQFAAFAEAIDALGSIPFAFYGHSMGGYIALQAAHSLRAQNRSVPVFLALGAVPTPEAVSMLVPEGIRTPEEISDDMVDLAISRMNSDIVSTGGMAATVIGRVRRDLWTIARARSEGRMTMTVHAEDNALLLGASNDAVATIDQLPGDDLHKLGHHNATVVPGSHLFVLEPAGSKAMTQVLLDRIRLVTDRPGG